MAKNNQRMATVSKTCCSSLANFLPLFGGKIVDHFFVCLKTSRVQPIQNDAAGLKAFRREAFESLDGRGAPTNDLWHGFEEPLAATAAGIGRKAIYNDLSRRLVTPNGGEK